jgi:iron(III) transport system permease protein
MPAYVLAYAATDFLQYSGPLQTALRDLDGRQGALWPDVRSLPGAAVLFVLCALPVRVPADPRRAGERARAADGSRAAARCRHRRRVREVALPLARPALVAGVALALMETLADYGVGAYFGLTDAVHRRLQGLAGDE